jgi:hypothetical protein
MKPRSASGFMKGHGFSRAPKTTQPSLRGASTAPSAFLSLRPMTTLAFIVTQGYVTGEGRLPPGFPGWRGRDVVGGAAPR